MRCESGSVCADICAYDREVLTVMANALGRPGHRESQGPVVTVFLWDAGSLSGVTDDEKRARRAAAAAIRGGHASVARVERALALPGIYTLVFDYYRTGTGWTAKRRSDGRVSWVPLPERGVSSLEIGA
jgi:hypothetical protein